MSGVNITFDKLILEGFGPFKEVTEFHFKPGVNVFVANNETGKSSMFAGLTATLFGLSHRLRSGSNFSRERLRNWDNPKTCRGELHLTSQGVSYQVKRDFDSHRVSLWRREENTGRMKLILEGVHNPEARRPLKAYDEQLELILGISSLDLFQDTFFVAQPLPESNQLSTALQGLLTGSSGTTFKDALDALLYDLKALTKFTGPNNRGLTPRNMSKEGKLEQLGETLQGIQIQIQRGKETADSLLEVQEQVQKIDAELKSKQQELQQKIATRQAWSSWQLQANQYATHAKERDKLENAVKEIEKLTESLQLVSGEISRSFAEFQHANPETESQLRELIALEKQMNDSIAANAEIKEQQLREAKEEEDLTRALEEYPQYKEIGPDPVDKIRNLKRSASGCLTSWQSFLVNLESIQTMQEQLKTTYAPFQEATEADLEILKSLDQQKASLSAEGARAKQAYETARLSVQAYEEAQAQHRDRYGDLLDLPDHTAAAAERKWQLLKQHRELEKQQPDPGTGKATTPVWMIAGSGIILSGAAFALLGIGNPTILILGMLVAFAIGAVAAKLLYRMVKKGANESDSTLRQQFHDVAGKIEALDQELGVFARADDLELARLVERFSQLKEGQLQLQKLKDQAAATDLAGLEQRVQQTQEAELSFFRQIYRYTEAFADIQDALNDWRFLLKELDRLQSSVSEFAQTNFGCGPDQVTEADPSDPKASEPWRELAANLSLLSAGNHGNKPTTLGSLMESVAGLTDSWWEIHERTAFKAAGLAKDLLELKQKKQTSLQLAIKQEEHTAQLRTAADSIRDPLAGILQANDFSPELALNRYKSWQVKAREADDTAMKRKTLIENQQAEDAEQLSKRLSRVKDQAAASMLTWLQHIEKYPGLPEPDKADDPEYTQKKLSELDISRQLIQEEIELLENKSKEAYRHLARLEGESPVDIAAAELELQELTQQQKNLELQADALTLAYREMEAAINEYRQTFQQRLEDKATAYCHQIVSGLQRQIVLDEQMNLGIIENGRPIAMEQLSKGARDQIYLSLRFAVADLLAEDLALPLLFDDPFTSTDAGRLKNIQDILDNESQHRQFFLLAHESQYQTWGEPIGIAKFRSHSV